MFVLAVVAVGCEQAESIATSVPSSSPTPTHTPTPTPTPEPTSTPIPLEPVDLSSLSLEHQAVKALMGLVPADYKTSIFADLKTILQDPSLKSALEERGLLRILGPAAIPIEEQVDSIVLALGGPGVLGILSGTLDAPKIINSLKFPGSEVETESYGAFEITKLKVVSPFITINGALSTLDETTAIFAVSLSAGSPSEEVIKTVLDVIEVSTANFLEDPFVQRLFAGVPAGVGMTVGRDCELFGAFDECTGVALSATRDGEDGVITGILEFASAEAAKAALPAIREMIEKFDPEDLIAEVEGNRVRLSAVVNVKSALRVALGSN